MLVRRRVYTVTARRAKLPPGSRRQKKEARRGLSAELDGVVRMVNKRIAELADKHKRTKAWVRAQLFGGSKSARFVRKAPKTRLYDAYIHFKAKEMNKDLAAGEKHDLWEIKEKVKKERPSYKHRPADEQERWLAEYKADKEASARDKRVNRKGEQLDAASTLRRVSTELDTLNTRTGVRAFVIAVRSDILSTLDPFIFCDKDIDMFFATALGKTVDQIARLLEMFVIHGPSGLATTPKNAADLKKTLRMLIQNKLDDAIAQRFPGGDAPCVAMNYESYPDAIVALHKVQLIGWTMCNGQITNPGKMPMSDARALYDALIKQTVRWEPVPEDGDNAAAPGINTAPAPKKRKQRSDKGVPRGPRKKAAKASDGADAASASTAQKKKKPARRAGPEDGSSSDSSSSDSSS